MEKRNSIKIIDYKNLIDCIKASFPMSSFIIPGWKMENIRMSICLYFLIYINLIILCMRKSEKKRSLWGSYKFGLIQLTLLPKYANNFIYFNEVRFDVGKIKATSLEKIFSSLFFFITLILLFYIFVHSVEKNFFGFAKFLISTFLYHSRLHKIALFFSYH